MRPGWLKAVAWRGVPWETTTYYNTPASSRTTCVGGGTINGTATNTGWGTTTIHGNTSTSETCNTQYTPATSTPSTWQHYTISNYVETADRYMVLSCTRNWNGSKCSSLEVNAYFQLAPPKNGKVGVLYRRATDKPNSKPREYYYDLASSQLK